MSFVELLLFIEKEKEKILSHNVNELLTDKHRYFKTLGQWSLDKEEGFLVEAFGRGGKYYVWQRKI